MYKVTFVGKWSLEHRVAADSEDMSDLFSINSDTGFQRPSSEE